MTWSERRRASLALAAALLAAGVAAIPANRHVGPALLTGTRPAPHQRALRPVLPGGRETARQRGSAAPGGPTRGAADGPLRLVSASAGSRPNLVLIVVDTLRADHLTSYGWPVPTSPNLDASVARPGVVVERAYSPAPWTIPSMVGLWTSRWPGEVMGSSPAELGIPPGTPTLPAALQALGYETAAFVGNPTLDEKIGFGPGFDRYYRLEGGPPPQWARADHLTRMARQWLRARRAEVPFFLYVHYVEPHDPYDSPELVAGRSPYFPAYRGTVGGEWPQGLMLGKIQLLDPLNDVRHLAALYDSEIHWMDRWLGALLAGFDAPTRARTLFVFTADHGEELCDHGSWKHGRTVYDEQLRVPLVVRWDGRLPAGGRLPAPVRLIDVAPTLLAAAGAPAPPTWQGEDLLPLLRQPDEVTAAPRSAFAAHYLDGPRRVAVVVGRWKLALFDRAARVAPKSDYESRLYRREMARLPRLALFDLLADPHERQDAAAAQPELVAALGGLVQERLGREVPGLRVLLAGVQPGVTVSVDLRTSGPARGWESSFLAPTDQVQLEGDRLRLTLVGEAMPKGVLLPAGTGIVAAGVVGPAGIVVWLGSGATYRGGIVAPAAMVRERWPNLAGPHVLLWQPVHAPAAPIERDPEARKRLQALGYAG
jgi:arylsulfatase A-like enzyme